MRVLMQMFTSDNTVPRYVTGSAENVCPFYVTDKCVANMQTLCFVGRYTV